MGWLDFMRLDSIFTLTTNLFYHCLIKYLRWLSSTIEQELKAKNWDYIWKASNSSIKHLNSNACGYTVCWSIISLHYEHVLHFAILSLFLVKTYTWLGLFQWTMNVNFHTGFSNTSSTTLNALWPMLDIVTKFYEQCLVFYDMSISILLYLIFLISFSSHVWFKHGSIQNDCIYILLIKNMQN